MGRTSTVKRLPKEVRDLVERLRTRDGRTIAEILAKLQELDIDIPQSTLGRWTKNLDAVAEAADRKRHLAEVLVEKMGDKPATEAARVNIELMHSILTKNLFGDDDALVSLTPQEMQFVSTAIQRLASASKLTADEKMAIEREVRKDAAEQIEKAATEAGLSAERVAQLRREFLGVRPKQDQRDAPANG